MSASLTVASVGDLFPNARFLVDGAPLDGGFEDTVQLLAAHDLRIGNLLMPFSDRGAPTEKLANIRATPEVAGDLSALGLDLVSLANNHIFDYGPDAYADTREAMNRIGVTTVGAGSTLDEAMQPWQFESRGIRVAVVAYSCLVPPGAAATSERPGIVPIRIQSSYEVNAQWAIEEPGEPEMVRICTATDAIDEARAVEQVEQLAASADVVLVSLHWGYGASERLADYQVPLGHALVDAGAGAILGHHVHAVQGVEVYRGRPILFSCGTFIGRQVPEDPSGLTELAARLIAAMSPDGYLARLTLEKAGVRAVELVPTTLGEHGLPLLGDREAAERVSDRVRRQSVAFDTKLEITDSGIVVPL